MNRSIKFVLIVGGVAGAIGFMLGALRGAAGLKATWLDHLPGLTLGMVAGAIYLQLANNRRVRTADRASRDAALAFAPPPGQALLIVSRHGFVGKAQGVDLMVDGRAVTQLKAPRFVVLPVAPGRHVLEAQAKMGKAEPLAVELGEGQAEFVEIKVAMRGLEFKRAVDEAALRAQLRGTPLVELDAGWA